MGNGRRLKTLTNNEYLDFTAVGKAWRQAMCAIPPGSIHTVTFDMTLPVDLEIDGAMQALHWETTLSDKGVSAVMGQKLIVLAVNLATVYKIRSGGGVGFEVIFDEAERPPPNDIKALISTLCKLSA